ncbi:MAG: HNH endonuclease [Acidobacteria bacterium]|nr:HNH endonuclease [Acidobacteriota bacterium]
MKRNSSARSDFQKARPCPSTGKTSGRCPGYVIDHVVPLKRGGADHPWNMQWQTKANAKAKDRVE